MTPAIFNGVQCAVEAPLAERSPSAELELKLERLQRDYAELNTAVFEAAQVHRRLCAPSLLRNGAFDVASEIFPVRHLPGDFFSAEETSAGLVLALGDIGGKGLAAGMWVTHLVGLIRSHTATNSDPETIVTGVNRDIARLAAVEPLSSLFVARLDTASGKLDYCSAGHPPALLLRCSGMLELLSDGGPVLGAVPDAGFDRGTAELDTGDLLLACLMVSLSHSTKRNRNLARCVCRLSCVARRAGRLSRCCFQCSAPCRILQRHARSLTT